MSAAPMSERPPVIILGANHAGTRLVVDVLRTLGSRAGRTGNEWLEDEVFLDIHRRLVARVTKKHWTQAIFDMAFVERFRDDASLVPEIRDWLAQSLADSFPDRSLPWHWKCPTAVMFLPSWLEIYPDALFVHIERDPRDVARSLVRRRQFLRFGRAAAFYEAMNRRVIEARPAMTNYLRLSVETLGGDLPALAASAGLHPQQEALDTARRSIRQDARTGWRADRSMLAGSRRSTTLNCGASRKSSNVQP